MATYKIVSGDTLSDIARKQGTTVAEIQRLNPSITDPNKIFAGSDINLPEAPKPSALDSLKTPSTGIATSDAVRAAEAAKVEDAAKKAETDAEEIARLRREKELKDLRESLAPAGMAPMPPSNTEEYKKLIAEKDAAGFSVQDYQQRVIDLRKEQGGIEAGLKKFKEGLTGISEAAAAGQYQQEYEKVKDRIDQITRDITSYNLQIANRNDVINTIMTLTERDYENASAAYDKEFSRNIQLQTFISQAENRTQDNARANLNMIQSSITAGTLGKYDELPQETRSMIDRLEIEAGMPRGITQWVTQNVKGSVVAQASRQTEGGAEYFDLLVRGSDGSLSVTSVYRGQGRVSGGETEEEQVKAFQEDVADYIEKIEARPPQIKPETAVKALRAKYPNVPETVIYAALGRPPMSAIK